MSRCKNSTKLSTPDPDLAKWCAVLSESVAVAEQVPPGWFTTEQLCKKTGQSRCRVQARIRRLFARGKAEKKTFRIQLKRQVRPVAHYRLK